MTNRHVVSIKYHGIIQYSWLARAHCTFLTSYPYTGISFTRIALALKPDYYLDDEAAACGFTVDLHLEISY